jgi:2-polyprenyl-3-methyl-5-hydroxy-6-metoxy-1,4-benzoquinol methylase
MASTRILRFSDIICSYLTSPGRVLEIGAGDGSLATHLMNAGHQVIAIDRKPRPTFPAIETTFEDYSDREPFDCVLAQLVLHHAGDLEQFIAKMVRLTKAGGIIAIDDYGWERSEDRAFRDDRRDLHTSTRMIAALDRALHCLRYEDHAYSLDGDGSDTLAFTYLGMPRIHGALGEGDTTS